MSTVDDSTEYGPCILAEMFGRDHVVIKKTRTWSLKVRRARHYLQTAGSAYVAHIKLKLLLIAAILRLPYVQHERDVCYQVETR
jgi:hypothetical protein